MKQRLDQVLVKQQLAPTRSQAEHYIKLGQVKVNKKTITKPGFLVHDQDQVELTASEQYVSRAGLKLASVAKTLGVDFSGATVLDVGSSTGGFTDYALQHGAEKVIAVDVGSQQLHPTLRPDPRIELHEKTDIREFKTKAVINVVVADVSFISLRLVLPAIARLSSPQTLIVAMAKPQFEAGESALKHRGVVKNERMRRDILKDFESWVQGPFIIIDKADSQVSGNKGNRERFYLLKKV